MVLFLNNYRQSGIGDFGDRLAAELVADGRSVSYTETVTGWAGFATQMATILASRQNVIANIGLTSWGRSGFRNLMGFFVLGIKGTLDRRVVILLHHVIEIIDPGDAGYRIDRTTRVGAHFAVRLLRACSIVVFSEEVAKSLRTSYGIEPVMCEVIPCDPPRPRTHERGQARELVSLGYVAPYKGLTILKNLALALRGFATISLVGGVHRVLGENPGFSLATAAQLEALRDSGVRVTGYVSEEELSRLLENGTAGVLTYSSSSGTSASFSRMASAGLAVFATDLPEFRRIEALGAGVKIVQKDPTLAAATIKETLNDESEIERLEGLQATFAGRHSWKLFVTSFLSATGLC